MLIERPVSPELRELLVDNDTFAWAHLIKFERPSRSIRDGVTSTSKERYTYLTDASRDVNFDDGSSNLDNVPNGTQVYIANKVLKISNVSEYTEAKASTFSLTLDGNGIGARLYSDSAVISVVNESTYDITWSKFVDPIKEGFREGDKVTITGKGDFNILNFREGNVIRLGKIDSELTAYTGSVEMTMSSEEVKSILLDKNLSSYASFINREVYIYRAYFAGGKVVGKPFLLFKGIISDVSFSDNDTGIEVTWGMTSHWGDFSQVRGRITSDDFHRALDQNGVPQPQSALKIGYAYDKGFSHSDTSINILAKYNVQVEKQDIKVKKGFLGIGSKVKVRKYFATEERTTELDFQLQAKAIPVIYGVRNVSGIPIFADTENANSSNVYIVRALSEGEIGGIYDVYVDGNSLICNDKADFDARSIQTPDNTVELICRGRSDRGDVLGGSSSIASASTDYYADQEYLINDINYNYVNALNYYNYVPPSVTVADTLGRGVFNGQSINLSSPQNITMDFFSGRSGQKAASQLVEIAKNNGFKVQNDFWKGKDTAEYWGPNHRLLDTAYVVIKHVIAEGETSIADLEFIIRGKTLEAYNYDFSYSHYTKASGESAANFHLGDYVTLYASGGTPISGPVQIIDKWTFVNADGSLNTRFRYSASPNLGMYDGVPSITKFYMANGSGQTWTMVTYNYKEFSGLVNQELSGVVTSVIPDDGYARFDFVAATGLTTGGDPIETTPRYSLINADGPIQSSYFTNLLLFGDMTSMTLKTKYLYSNYSPIPGPFSIVSRNTVRLPGNASTDNDYYKGYKVTLTKYDSLTDREIVQEKRIIAYDGADRVATIDDIWDLGMTPDVGDKVDISPPYCDSRISINPAIQTLDYVTSTTYGRGLHPHKDLDLPSWLESARACDTQSNVTVQTVLGAPTYGTVYQYPQSGPLLWQGTVVGSENGYTEFTDNLGKLTNAWKSWKNYALNELVHIENRLYRVTTPGVKTESPSHTGGNINGLEFISDLTLHSTNGGPDLGLVTDGNPIRSLKDGVRIPGYSLYDSDGADYWRLLGWDEFSQRYVTRHQTNLAIDTSLPLFENTNSLLEHFGGIMRYSSGKYYLEVEDYSGPISTEEDEIRNITADHIVGKISLSDQGIRSAFNSLTAAYADPANKFDSRNISFFNSDYLKSDRNVPKKGNISVPGVTNYYNTRILADKFLNRSRFGLTAQFNLIPRGALLLSGTVIQIQYPSYGWVDKKFRISTLTHLDDCSVDVVAEEYDDSFYILSKLSKQAASGLGGTAGLTSIASPTDLRASSIDNGDETYSGVSITWVNNPAANTKNVSTELYSSYSSHLFLTINSISGNVLTSSTNHELVVGELITSQSTVSGLESGKSYFVKEVISPTQFTLAQTKDGAILGLSNSNDVGAIMRTAGLLATLPIPTNSYVDVFGGINGRVIKYYWVRHKIVQG
jgi:hypothetical protein